MSEEHPITYVYESPGGHEISMSFSHEAALEVVAMSTSEALLRLGEHGQKIQSALSRLFSE